MVSNVYPDHRYFFLESGNSDNDLQLLIVKGVIQQLCERSPRNLPEQILKIDNLAHFGLISPKSQNQNPVAPSVNFGDKPLIF